MDEQLRELEHQYLVEPDGQLMLQILAYYARRGETPTGDIRALELLNFADIPKKRGITPHEMGATWPRQFNIEQIRDLESLGYPIGVYFKMSCPSDDDQRAALGLLVRGADAAGRGRSAEETFTRITEQLASILSSNSQPPGNYSIRNCDSIDGLDVSPGNSNARSVQDGGRALFEHNREHVNRKRVQSPDLLQTIRNFSLILGETVKKDGSFKINLRIFIPAEALEKAFAIEITNQRSGFSRSTVRARANSTIDWGTVNQVAGLKTLLNNELRNSLSYKCIAQDFGCNLLLALSTYWSFRKSWLD